MPQRKLPLPPIPDERILVNARANPCDGTLRKPIDLVNQGRAGATTKHTA